MTITNLDGVTMLTTTNPRTGQTSPLPWSASSDSEVARVADASRLAVPALAALGREGRAQMLDAIADALESERSVLVSTADDETGLGLPRLNGELTRSVFQFRLFAEALREGSYVEAAIDHAADTALGAAPDLRRMLVPLGPVAVFGSSNFPFAFSVAGGDTASALAAGCPVVLKAHSSHPLTSAASFEAIEAGLAAAGAPAGTIGMVFGQVAGGRLVAHPSIAAVGFTGSLSAGQALLGIITGRPDPIPFYGELSSLNPLVVTAAAAVARTMEIARGLFASVTGSGGQLCTKPGIAFVPTGDAGDALVGAVRELVLAADGHVLLNRRIRDAYEDIGGRLVGGGATVAARADLDGEESGFLAAPTLLTTSSPELTAEIAEECFGPLVVVVRYAGIDELSRAISVLPNSLTATIHAEPDEDALLGELTDLLLPTAGRIVYNGFPTGVRVSWAQHHGGPWPATNSLHSSVGVSAIRRFLRPVAWQDAPRSVLPEELRDGAAGIPRRIDGVLVLPG